MSKVMELIIAHCEVCPHSVAAIPEGLRCRYPPNLTRYSLDKRAGRRIQSKELPIPSWCKLPDKVKKI